MIEVLMDTLKSEEAWLNTAHIATMIIKIVLVYALSAIPIFLMYKFILWLDLSEASREHTEYLKSTGIMRDLQE